MDEERVATYRGDQVTTCRGCGKKIVFAEGPNGKLIPLDLVAPVYRLENDVRPDGVKLNAVREPNSFVSHFATCSQANRFGGSKKKTGRGS